MSSKINIISFFIRKYVVNNISAYNIIIFLFIFRPLYCRVTSIIFYEKKIPKKNFNKHKQYGYISQIKSFAFCFYINAIDFYFSPYTERTKSMRKKIVNFLRCSKKIHPSRIFLLLLFFNTKSIGKIVNDFLENYIFLSIVFGGKNLSKKYSYNDPRNVSALYYVILFSFEYLKKKTLKFNLSV